VALKVTLLLALALGLTVRQLPVWSSNVALWEQAASVNRVSPRPAFNLALAYQHAGQLELASAWYVEAVRRAEATGTAAAVRAHVRAQVLVIEQSGIFPCESLSLSSLCF
jgi:Tfp pilus assembly protein PilF